MSHNCHVDVVPFAAHYCFQQDSYTEIEELPEEKQMILSPECYVKGELCDNPKNPIILNGWTYKGEFLGKKKNIAGDCWEKESFCVWLVNEHQYCNVGEYDVAVVGDNRESVEEFLKDFDIDRTIEDTESVMWWA
jgi:hypothetical protein